MKWKLLNCEIARSSWKFFTFIFFFGFLFRVAYVSKELEMRNEIEVAKLRYSCLLMDPTKFCPFFTTSWLLRDPKTLCLLMDPNQDFPLSKSHVFWWTQFLYIFSKFSPLKPHVFWWIHSLTDTSCLFMDPEPSVF